MFVLFREVNLELTCWTGCLRSVYLHSQLNRGCHLEGSLQCLTLDRFMMWHVARLFEVEQRQFL